MDGVVKAVEKVDGVQFEFSDSVVVCKFDELPQFQALTGYGTKGCDLVVVDEEKLWLVEVKDYDHRERTEPEPPASELIPAVVQKVLGTTAILFLLAREATCKGEGATCEGQVRKLVKAAAKTTEVHVVLHIEPKRTRKGKILKNDHIKILLKPYKDALRRAWKNGLKVRAVHVSTNFEPVEAAPWTASRDPDTRLR